jgi:hypothetical protein
MAEITISYISKDKSSGSRFGDFPTLRGYVVTSMVLSICDFRVETGRFKAETAYTKC